MDREIDQVLMNVNKTAGGIVSAMLFASAMSFKLLTYMARLAKKGLVASGILDNFKDFNQRTSGKFSIYNIPLSQEKAEMMERLNELTLALDNEKNPIKSASIRNEIKDIERQLPELEQLKKLGIEFSVLPKLNGSSQTIQVAIANTDDQKFKNWYLNHLTTELNGGEKNLEAIKVFTEGNYTILNMPFEDQEELQTMYQDFRTMQINYAVYPDLNVGDGYTQIAIPNADRSLVEDWFKLWKEKQLSEGKEVTKECYTLDENSYASTGEISTENYISTSDSKYQEVNAEFEQEAKELPWTPSMRHENSPEYVKLLQDKNYEKITINKEKLVDGLDTTNMEFLMEHTAKKGLFVSRVPGTYGDKQEALVLPYDQVFTTDDGKTYVAFLHKGKDCQIANNKGEVKHRSFAESYAPYDVVSRNLNAVKSIQQEKKKTMEKVPMPSRPTVEIPNISIKP